MFAWLNDWFIQWLMAEEPATDSVPMCDFERTLYEIRQGDVILVEGRSRLSEMIQLITLSSWSHAGIYIGRLHDIENPRLRNLVSSHFSGPADTQLVVESILGKGTVVIPLNTYAKDNIRICRPKGLSRQDAQHIVAFTIDKLGHQYDVRHVFDLARFLFPWGLFPRHYRSSLFKQAPTQSVRTVCSSMIAEAFASVEFPILPLVVRRKGKDIELINRNTKLFTPRDFDYSPYFEIIKFPFLDITDDPAYRKLPWNKEGLVSHDQLGVRTVQQVTDFEMDNPRKKAKKKKFLGFNRLKEKFAKQKAEKKAETEQELSVPKPKTSEEDLKSE